MKKNKKSLPYVEPKFMPYWIMMAVTKAQQSKHYQTV